MVPTKPPYAAPRRGQARCWGAALTRPIIRTFGLSMADAAGIWESKIAPGSTPGRHSCSWCPVPAGHGPARGPWPWGLSGRDHPGAGLGCGGPGPQPVAWHPAATVSSKTAVPPRRGRPPTQPHDSVVHPTRPPPQGEGVEANRRNPTRGPEHGAGAGRPGPGTARPPAGNRPDRPDGPTRSRPTAHRPSRRPTGRRQDPNSRVPTAVPTTMSTRNSRSWTRRSQVSVAHGCRHSHGQPILRIMGAATTERDPAAAPTTHDHKVRL
jgi:hypothetical protein